MVAKAKLFAKLDLLEAELAERIVPHLEVAARGEMSSSSVSSASIRCRTSSPGPMP